MGDTPPTGTPATILRGLAEAHPDDIRGLIQGVLNRCGQNRSKAARMLGVSRTVFYDVARDLGLVLLPARNAVAISRAGLILELNLARGNRSAVARKLGVSRTTVAKWVRKYKLEQVCDPSHWKTE